MSGSLKHKPLKQENGSWFYLSIDWELSEAQGIRGIRKLSLSRRRSPTAPAAPNALVCQYFAAEPWVNHRRVLDHDRRFSENTLSRRRIRRGCGRAAVVLADAAIIV